MRSEPVGNEQDAYSQLSVRMEWMEEAKEIAAQKSVDGNPTSLLSKSWDDPPYALPAAVTVPETPSAPPDAPKVGIFTSSNAGDEYVNHFLAMSTTGELGVGQSFVLAKSDYQLDSLKEIARCKSVGKRVFVVIASWPEHFEIKRLPDGANALHFYRMLNGKGKKEKTAPSSKSETIKKIKDYVESNLENCIKYDTSLTAELKRAGIISYAYLQRRCSCLAAFRNSEKGSNNEFKCALEELEKDGALTAVNEAGKAKMYKINIEKLEKA